MQVKGLLHILLSSPNRVTGRQTARATANKTEATVKNLSSYHTANCNDFRTISIPKKSRIWRVRAAWTTFRLFPLDHDFPSADWRTIRSEGSLLKYSSYMNPAARINGVSMACAIVTHPSLSCKPFPSPASEGW